MKLTLKPHGLLRLEDAAGSLIEVLSGQVWVTEHGRAGDRLLGPGRRYRVSGDGLVLVGTEIHADDGADAEIAVRPAWRWLRERVASVVVTLAAGFRARRTVRELQEMSDHMLRDIGLRRDQIEAVSRSTRVL
jgi:uncharacterized protein YjiS (DUF1127 family)